MPQSLRQTMPQLAVRIQTPIRFRTEGLEEHTSPVRRRTKVLEGIRQCMGIPLPRAIICRLFLCRDRSRDYIQLNAPNKQTRSLSTILPEHNQDETRHLVATMALLRAMSQEFTEEQKLTVTRQMKQGFIFLSPLLYEHKSEFWRLPSDFDKVDHELEQIARDSGLGC